MRHKMADPQFNSGLDNTAIDVANILKEISIKDKGGVDSNNSDSGPSEDEDENARDDSESSQVSNRT